MANCAIYTIESQKYSQADGRDSQINRLESKRMSTQTDSQMDFLGARRAIQIVGKIYSPDRKHVQRDFFRNLTGY